MRTRKLIVGILIFVAAMATLAFSNKTQAASSGLGYVSITSKREATVKYIATNPSNPAETAERSYTAIYKHQLNSLEPEKTKNIWKLITCTQGGTPTSTGTDLYCLRAGLGFTTDVGGPDYNPDPVKYDQAFEMPRYYEYVKDYLSGLHSETTIFNNKDSFNSVMWILDNMLLETATDDEVTAYLKKYAGYTDEDLNLATMKENVLTTADIEAVQQLAIWYFTNSDVAEYHSVDSKGLPILTPLYLNIEGSGYETGGKYKSLDNIFNKNSYGEERQEAAETLYRTLISKAETAAVASRANVNGLYSPNKSITVYLAGNGSAGVEQPIVQVKEKGSQADVALRKYISAINGEKLEGESSREPEVDTSELNQVVDREFQTTAKYNHPKKPLSVKIGDYVTYTIRLYNEGEIPAYIKEVTDYIPSWLAYVAYGDDEWTAAKGGPYWVLSDDGFIAVTSANCPITGAGGKLNYSDIQGKTLGEVLIPAAWRNENPEDPKDTYTLSYVDIQITCQVMEKAPYSTPITNIAEITNMTDADGTLLSDRDSDSLEKRGKVIIPDSEDLPTYMEEESEFPYVPGQQDDDDFDKVMVESPIIDMALRKFITKIGNTTYNRAPVVNTSPLRNGSKTTAIYEHSKKPIVAEVGDIVTYTIRLYNEGEVDGKVKEVTDYVSKYLAYVPNEKGKAMWVETKGQECNKLVSTEDCIITAVRR